MNFQNLPLNKISKLIRGVTFKREEVLSHPLKGFVPILRAGNIGDGLDIENNLVWVRKDKVKQEQKMRI